MCSSVQIQEASERALANVQKATQVKQIIGLIFIILECMAWRINLIFSCVVNNEILSESDHMFRSLQLISY